MGKPISFADLDCTNAGLKKARALLILLQDSEKDQDKSWCISAIFDLVHIALNQIDEMIDEAIKK